MNTTVEHHPWGDNRLETVDAGWLAERGVDTSRIQPDIADILARASGDAAEIYALIYPDRKPPLLRFGEEPEVVWIDGFPPEGKLSIHKNTSDCPAIYEVTPARGCHINCAYCLWQPQIMVQQNVEVYQNYPEFFAQQLSMNADKADRQGAMYYLSPLTEMLSPWMVRTGMAQRLIGVFADYVEEQIKKEGHCKDTLFSVTKGGREELLTPGPNGDTVLDQLKRIPDHVQLSTSLTNYPDRRVQEALEPGARPIAERLKMVAELQRNHILTEGALCQPIFFPWIDHLDDLFQQLSQAGVRRIKTELLTSSLMNLAFVLQVVGWFDQEAANNMWEEYLTSPTPAKGPMKRMTVSRQLQQQIYHEIFEKASKHGIEFVTYCRYVEKVAGLPELDYREPGETNPKAVGGCMAFHSSQTTLFPQPEVISAARINQRNS